MEISTPPSFLRDALGMRLANIGNHHCSWDQIKVKDSYYMVVFASGQDETKSCTLISSSNRQDGPIVPAVLFRSFIEPRLRLGP